MQISSVEGNRQWLDGGAMFGNAPRPVWEKWFKPDELGRIPLSCRALLLEIDESKILCETGIGAFFEPKMAQRFGVENHDRHILRENLERLGVKEEDIDFVILSHLHFDHAGGLLPTYAEIQGGREDLLFPRANYVVGQEAWNRALNPHSRDRASFIPGLTDKLQNSGRLIVLSGEKHPAILPERISFFVSNGHTPGQMHTICRGDKFSVIFAGDMIPGVAWVHVPITMGYDRFPEMLIDEKSKLYERVANEDWRVFFTHDPEYSLGRIHLDENKRYVATDKLGPLVHMDI